MSNLDYFKQNKCQFHGNLRDLIPAGFKFQKLFADNYRQYHYEIDINNYIRVWQHHGAYVEVAGMGTVATNNLYKLIKEKGVEHLKVHYNHRAMGSGYFYRWVVNYNYEIVEYDIDEHDTMLAHFDMRENGYDEAYIMFVIQRMYERNRVITCNQNVMDAIFMMIDKGFVVP